MRAASFSALMVPLIYLGCAQSSAKPETLMPPVHEILVIGHRGASGYRPEHTIASYQLAIEKGADYIEPDLVVTKDGVLIARHENEISGTTDVASKFPSRKTTKKLEGHSVTGWFAEDFTLAEIKTLRAKERLATRDHSFDGKFEIPTLDEILSLAETRSKELGRVIGVYPETKHPSYFESLGMPLEPALAKILEKHHQGTFASPIFLQSAELGSLLKLKKLVNNKLILLIDAAGEKPVDFALAGDPRTYGDLITPDGLKELAKSIYGIGPNKRLIVPDRLWGAAGLGTPTSLVADAHAAGLKVHPYTFRSDRPFLNVAYFGDPEKEYEQFYELGVDAVFSDFADHAFRARERFRQKQQPK